VGIGGRRRFSKGLAMVFCTSLSTVLVCFIFVNCKVGDYLDGYLYVRSWQIEITISSLYKSTMGNGIYVDIASVWYDHVDSSTWSPIMLENLMEEIAMR
jgi:hypothetical protein